MPGMPFRNRGPGPSKYSQRVYEANKDIRDRWKREERAARGKD